MFVSTPSLAVYFYTAIETIVYIIATYVSLYFKLWL